MSMARNVVVEVDCREQNPVSFPATLVWTPKRGSREVVRIKTVSKRLPYGDYRLAQYPKCCVVERKAGVDELAANLLSRNDRVRFSHAWAKFSTGCDYPVLLLDSSLHQTGSFKYDGGNRVATPEDAMSAFWRLVVDCPRLTVIWAGTHRVPKRRTQLGAELVRLMLACAERGAS